MALWTAQMVELVLGRDLTDEEATRLHAGLGAMVQADASAFCNRPLESTVIVGERHRLSESRVVPYATPVISVQSVTLDGVTLAPADYAMGDGCIYVFAVVNLDDSYVTFNYTAGVDATLAPAGYAAVAGVLCTRLARILRMQAAGIGEEVQSISQEGEQVNMAGGVRGIAGWNQFEESILTRYRRRVMR